MDIKKPRRHRRLLHEEKVLKSTVGAGYPCEARYGSNIDAHFAITIIHGKPASKEEKALFRKIKPKCEYKKYRYTIGSGMPLTHSCLYFDRLIEDNNVIGYDHDRIDTPKCEGKSCFKIHDSIKNLWHNQLQEWVDYSNQIKGIKREKKEKKVNRNKKIKSWFTNLVKRK